MSGSGAATLSQAPAGRTGWVVMSALWAVDGTSTVMIFLIGLTLPEIRNEFNISPVQEGYLGSAFFVALTTLSLPSAIWMSRFSPRLVTLLALIGMTITAVLQGIAPNYWILLAARLMFMYALVSRTQAEVMLIQQWFSGPRIATLNSITVASFGIGQLAAIGLVPILMPHVGGWRGIHLLLAVVYAAVAVAWFIVGRERPYQTSSAEAAPTALRADGTPGGPAGVLKRHPILFVIASTQFGGAMAWATFVTFFPTFAPRRTRPIAHYCGLAILGIPYWRNNRLAQRRPLIQLDTPSKTLHLHPGLHHARPLSDHLVNGPRQSSDFVAAR